MTVYVDKLPSNASWGRWAGGAHMLGTNLEELHAFAHTLGLRRSWFQGDATFAHYDLTPAKRAGAVARGAVEIEAGELPDDVLMRCPDGSYESRGARMARRALLRDSDAG